MEDRILTKLVNEPYKYGFSTNIKKDNFPTGINEEIIRLISEKKNEPRFMLDFRLKSYNRWKNLVEPKWSILKYNNIDFQQIIYYSAPQKKKNQILGRRLIRN